MTFQVETHFFPKLKTFAWFLCWRTVSCGGFYTHGLCDHELRAAASSIHSFLGPGLFATVTTRGGDSAGKLDELDVLPLAAPSISLHFAGGLG